PAAAPRRPAWDAHRARAHPRPPAAGPGGSRARRRPRLPRSAPGNADHGESARHAAYLRQPELAALVPRVAKLEAQNEILAGSWPAAMSSLRRRRRALRCWRIRSSLRRRLGRDSSTSWRPQSSAETRAAIGGVHAGLPVQEPAAWTTADPSAHAGCTAERTTYARR